MIGLRLFETCMAGPTWARPSRSRHARLEQAKPDHRLPRSGLGFDARREREFARRRPRTVAVDVFAVQQVGDAELEVQGVLAELRRVSKLQVHDGEARKLLAPVGVAVHGRLLGLVADTEADARVAQRALGEAILLEDA